MATKITFVGKPGMGKTTIKKVIFEGENANELMLFPLETTIRTKFSVHDFMDLKISLVDTPGQSMPLLLEDEDRQEQTFENASVIIYLFDYAVWISQPQEIIENIKKIYDINVNGDYGAKIFLYLHKIDLINQKIRGRLNIIKNDILNQLDLPEELPIYFTSLHPDLRFSIYNAISDTLSSFSEDTSKLNGIISKITTNLSRTICFVTNQNDSILIQNKSEDFDISLIENLQKKIFQLSQVSEDISLSIKIIDVGAKILYAAMDNISTFHSSFKKLIVLSETLGKNDLNDLVNTIKEELNHFK